MYWFYNRLVDVMLTIDLNKLKKELDWACNHHDNRHIRRGQMLFNMLHDKYPKIANSLRGTLLDTFYQDSRITDCLRHLAQLAGENDIRLAVFGKEAEDERKEDKKGSFEVGILQSIQKRMVTKDIPRTEGEMVERSKSMEKDLQSDI